MYVPSNLHPQSRSITRTTAPNILVRLNLFSVKIVLCCSLEIQDFSDLATYIWHM